MNKNELRSVMARYGDSYQDLATALDKSLNAVTLKINGQKDFTRTEIKIIIDRYNLSPEDVVRIFFA